jgi:hypothetical protein
MTLGYPGVRGPDTPKKDTRITGEIIASDAVNTLIKTEEGLRVLPNSKVKK